LLLQRGGAAKQAGDGDLPPIRTFRVQRLAFGSLAFLKYRPSQLAQLSHHGALVSEALAVLHGVLLAGTPGT